MSVPSYPVRVDATLEPGLSRWLWLVKWVLAIPHYLVLALLWVAFGVLSLVAFFAILFTGRYPRGIFDFNVGVLRWTWRVAYYTYGGLGTDHYPPFTLSEVPDYPAHLDVAYPTTLSRGLVLVKWWLLAIPHYLVLAVFLGGGWYATSDQAQGDWSPAAAGGLIGLLVFVAAVVLLFTGRYPQSIFDLVLGMNRWVLRVAAYVSLMTDQYPPFRLDMGGPDPAGGHLAVPPHATGPAPSPTVDTGTASFSASPGASAPTPAAGTTAPPAPTAPTGPSGSSGAPPPTSTPPATSTGSTWGAGRVIGIVVGSLLAVMAMGLLGGGATLGIADRALRDDAGYLMSPTISVTAAGAAVTSQSMELRSGASSTIPERILGRGKVRAVGGAGHDVFVGIARSRDVAAYLARADFSTVIDPSGDGGVPTYRHHPGGAVSQPPTGLSIWAASASGAGEQTITWPIKEGDWTLVVMNADGSPGVAADVAVGATLPAASWLVVSLLVAGVLLLGVAALILVVSVRRPPQPATAAAAPPAAQS